MELRYYQKEAVEAAYEHLRTKDTNPCIVLPTGCHAKDHPILMYDGSVKKVQDVQVGDLLMGDDSTPRRVLALARGREPMAKITPKKGEPFVVNVNHILHAFSLDKAENVNIKVKKLLKKNVNQYQLNVAQNISAGKRVCFQHVAFSVELLPEDDFFGFALDGNHLYVDGNFVVHHNTGKSVVIAKIVSDAIKLWNGRVLILAHVKELLEQNAAKIKAFLPDIPVGIYSAGLKSRSTDEPVIVAGIQSVYNKACDLGAFDLVIVDEAHLIPTDGDGMYRKFLKDMKVVNPKVRVLGLTATPFRLKGGLICKPENILNEVCYEAGLKEMIEQGFLSPIVARAGNIEADFSKLHIKGGEFVAKEVEKLMDMPEITNAACEEIVELTKDRKTVLIFCTSVAHSKHVADKITELTGCECAIVTGDTPAQERADVIERLRGNSVKNDLLEEPKPPLKYCANVAVMTTGLDIPNIDCVVMLRPTASPGLLLQIAGRGLRLAPNKTECVFLDFGGNILRHGPLDMIKDKVENKKPYKGRPKGDCTAKKCPECSALIYARLEVCPYCGYEFPMDRTPKIQMHASTLDVISKESIFNEYEVKSVSYEVHEKRFSSPEDPKTMRVDYDLGNFVYKSEWVCPEHGGYAGEKFEKWWKERAALGCPIPVNAQEAVELANAGALMTPRKIIVKTTPGEKFDRITKAILPQERPVWEPHGDYPKEWDEVPTQPYDPMIDDQIPF